MLQFLVLDAIGDTIFKSGTFTPDARVVGENPAYETHHDFISQSDIPQIYEMVMGDVNSNFTSVLERAAVLLKDNRLPPLGFTTQHNVYAVSYTHLRAHETVLDLVCRLLLEKKKK